MRLLWCYASFPFVTLPKFGKVATVLLDDDESLDALNALEAIDESWAQSIAGSLRAAQARHAEADRAEM